MWENLIAYFGKRHLLTNFIAIGVFLGGIFFWYATPKEELPNIEMNFVRVSAVYPGASPEEVEHFVTKPIEQELQGVNGLYKVVSTSGTGLCSIRIEIDDTIKELTTVVNDITDAVNRADLPRDIRDDPVIKHYKTSQKAIIDIALIHKNKELLDKQSRRELQKYTLALENQLLSLPEVSSINKSGYLRQEIRIRVKPEKVKHYNISMNTIMAAVQDGHIRTPAGSIEDKAESKVTIRAELNAVNKLKKQIIRGGFEGQVIRLKDMASVVDTFEDSSSITKVNGHECVLLNVVKSSSYGIIEAIEVIKKKTGSFKQNSLAAVPVDIVLLDDESRDVRERLTLIGMNGTIGFVFIIITLLVFLNMRAGLWVALGIPFSFCFTMIVTSAMGYTINNMTLSAVIIVMGMVVDDAIVVAENISRLKSEGYESFEAAVKGASYVFLPIVASIATTCVAFLPMLMFTGRLAKFISIIPPIVSLMLLGSLLESVLILPAHMNLNIPRPLRIIFSLGTLPFIEKYYKQKKEKPEKPKKLKKTKNGEYAHWFSIVENSYGRFLDKVLKRKSIVFLVFISLLLIAGFVFTKSMKFVMFPGEEATQIAIVAEAGEGTKSYGTAVLAGQLEAVFAESLGKDVVGFRTYIGQSRHGRIVEENNLFMRVELVSREKRDKPLSQLKTEWKEKIKNVKDLSNIRFLERRFGQSSGSPIEILVQQNDDAIRKKVVDELHKEMKKHPALTDVEIDRPMFNPEYRIDLKRDIVSRLDIKSSAIAATFRSILQGTVLYELIEGDDEIDVRLTTEDSAKKSIQRVLSIPVENNSDYLVPMKDVVKIKKIVTPYSIQRQDYKRTTTLFAELYGKENEKRKKMIVGNTHAKNNKSKKDKNKKENPGGEVKKVTMTPLEVADYFDSKVFPRILARYPTSVISFVGEVKDSRESRGDFLFGILAVLFLIYAILSLLFNSMLKPFIIMVAIPFGVVGVILAFWFHGIAYFGFFAAVGILGLTGVVVNDSIVMVSKLEKEYDMNQHREFTTSQIADIAKTRLRAVLLTTFTTVAGLFPTAYGIAGYDSMLAEMMLAMGWGLLFATGITLVLVPAVYSVIKHVDHVIHEQGQ
ncbi:MAG: efflux RND transporter permease subunit [bacterium]|nr:efflux RND transporter permease subunit [bacterium]